MGVQYLKRPIVGVKGVLLVRESCVLDRLHFIVSIIDKLIFCSKENRFDVTCSILDVFVSKSDLVGFLVLVGFQRYWWLNRKHFELRLPFESWTFFD